MVDGDLDGPWDAAFTAQEEQRAGLPPRPMLTRAEAMAKANAYFREETEDAAWSRVTAVRYRRDNVLMSPKAARSQPNAQAQLSVRNGQAAVDFYKAAFGAVEVYRFGGTDGLDEVVAQLAVGNSLFWVEDESPPHGNFSPETVGGATARMLLIVDDPESVLARALAEGATPISPVGDEHGWRLGRIDDPFGHRWEIGKPINDWPPAEDPQIAG